MLSFSSQKIICFAYSIFKPLTSISNTGQKVLSDAMQGKKGESPENKSWNDLCFVFSNKSESFDH